MEFRRIIGALALSFVFLAVTAAQDSVPDTKLEDAAQAVPVTLAVKTAGSVSYTHLTLPTIYSV